MCDQKLTNKLRRIYETDVDTAFFRIHMFMLINTNQS